MGSWWKNKGGLHWEEGVLLESIRFYKNVFQIYSFPIQNDMHYKKMNTASLCIRLECLPTLKILEILNTFFQIGRRVDLFVS